MKIEKVIFTIDDNPHYKAFWKSISRHYKMRMSITPVLYLICDRSATDIDSYCTDYGEVRVVDKIEGIPSIIQALIGKFYFTTFERDTTWLIGDLDLYPMQQYHFKDSLILVDDESYAHLNPHAYGENWREGVNGLAGYFHVAKGRVFAEELKFTDKSFEEVCSEIHKSTKWGIQFYGMPSSWESRAASPDYGWFCSEEMYTGDLLKKSNKLVEVVPKNKVYSRLDRSDMRYHEELIRGGYYIDFHAPRPYENHESTIEQIISKIPLQD